MTWARLDDDLTFHEKIVEAGNAATGVWCRALAWSSQHLTDGYIPAKIARLVAGESRGALKALTRSRLWVDCPGGYRIHNYLKYNPSRAEVLEKREKERTRKADLSARKAGGSAAASDTPVPSRPVPSLRDGSVPEMISMGDLIRLGRKRKWKRPPSAGSEVEERLLAILPLTKAEFEEAAAETDSRAMKPNYGYFTSVVETIRNQPPPDSEWERGRANEDKRSKKKRPQDPPSAPYHEMADLSKYD